MRRSIQILLVTAALLFYSFGASALTLRFAHSTSHDSLQQEMALHFKAQLEQRTSGDIRVEIFPMGQLGTDQQLLQGAKSGTIDIVLMGANNYSGELPEIAVFTLPFIFGDREAAYRVLDGEVGNAFLSMMEKFGVKGLGYPENGFRNMTNNRKPIKMPADVSGLNMRVNNSKVLAEMFRMLGATPHEIPVAELYAAFDMGLVNAQDHPVGVVVSQQYYFVQRYLSMTQHAYSPLVLSMSMKSYMKLSEQQRTIVEEVAKSSVDMQRELSATKESGLLEELEQNGMIINHDVDSATFQEEVKPVWDSFIEKHGEEWTSKIQDALK
ncbi:DctP family TRAP transporter solute-binding subunit [Vibrio sp. JC009]|uniref:DctP family TRAP transporter solute-binding subunit n=1 Tax=Vibrio sp. JC009 TaxID=2912314 RepID=UPI0023AF8FA5|nr:DctP family TRAP transporter solute-binding subunit [Vibrio sp. JC009]WED20912.1 DctP family TRAP transporter solute-binding subunit [Vibrio sp. JC009]